MAESDGYRRRIELLAAVDAEMAEIHEQVLRLMRKGLSEDDFYVKLAVSGSLDCLVEAVDTVIGYTEHPPAELVEADRIVLVDRSGTEPIESTFPIADWNREGPRIFAAALERWADEGGTLRLSGSRWAGRGTAITDIPSGHKAGYIAYAWYAATATGAIHPIPADSKEAK